MPKNKRHKYERVKQLPNVTLSESCGSHTLEAYPWHANRYAKMQTVLELGCGKGEHSIAFAAANPRRLYVGIDYKSHRMCVGAERAMAKGLSNVLFLRTRAECLRDFFSNHSIHAIWLTFPDPHLKNRKSKCRLTAAPFLDIYADLLVPDGTVHVKTDSARFCRFSRESVQRWGGREVAYVVDWHGSVSSPSEKRKMISAYEVAALYRGAMIRHLAFKLS